MLVIPPPLRLDGFYGTSTRTEKNKPLKAEHLVRNIPIPRLPIVKLSCTGQTVEGATAALVTQTRYDRQKISRPGHTAGMLELSNLSVIAGEFVLRASATRAHSVRSRICQARSSVPPPKVWTSLTVRCIEAYMDN